MKLTEQFIQKYRDYLEDIVLQHLNVDKVNKTSMWTLKRAHDHVEKMVTTLFGTPQHTGIIQYLDEEQKHLKLTPQDALLRGEKMVEEGWSIKKENERYFLLDSNYRKVKDVSGSPDITPAPVDSDIGPENCWMMLSEKYARDMAKQAAVQGVDSKLLVSPEFAYEFVVNKLGTESELFPFAQMYKGMGEILRKLNYFPSEDLVSLDQMRADGYRIEPKINPQDKPKSYISSGAKSYTILPVGDKYIGDMPSDKVFVPESIWKRDLMKSLGVVVETPIQIGELGFTFALGFEDKEHYASVQDMGEVTRLLYSIQNQNKARNYPLFDKIVGQVASVYFLENFIVGNANFTLANISLDTVKPETTLRYTSQGRMYQTKQLKYALENMSNGQPSITIVDFLSMCPPITEQDAIDNMGVLVQALPEQFKKALKSATSEDSYIQGNIDTVGAYL